jgi:hypothetical protein
MLKAIQQREIQLIEADGIKHAPTIGDQYEGLTSSLVTKMLPMPLDLQVVNGFVEGLNGELSGQIDCMLVRGTGKPIVHTGAYKWPVRDVLAVFEVKKTLFSEELSDAHDQLSAVLDQYWRYLASGPTEDYDITASRYVYGQIIGEPPPPAEEVPQLAPGKATIYHHLVAEQVAPLRIVLGYGGYASEFTLRKGFLKLIKKRDEGVGLTASSLPSLIISGKSSIIRFNGHPYYHKLQQGRLLFYASSSEDPLLLLLNLLLTKISYVYAAPDWFAEDTSLESFAPLLWARTIREGNDLVWLYTPQLLKQSQLGPTEKSAQQEWAPLQITDFQGVVLKMIETPGVTRENLSLIALDLAPEEADRQISQLHDYGLVSWVGDKLVFLTRQCVTAFTAGGVVAADGTDPRYLKWIKKQDRGSRSGTISNKHPSI